MQRGIQVICSRRRMEAMPRSESGTTCHGVPGNPKRSSRTFCVSRPRQDRVYYAIRLAAGEKACGQICFLDIQPEQGVIEIGAIWFGLTLRRTRSATESIYLMLRYAMDDLG